MDEDTGLNPAGRKAQEFDSLSFRQIFLTSGVDSW